MKPWKNWRLWLGFAVSAFFIWFAMRQIKDWHTFFNSFRSINYWYLIPVFLGYAVVMLCRAWRWHYIIRSQHRIKFSSTLIGLIICYMANNILPLRAGEIIRALTVARREKQSFSPLMATVVVERIFDTVAILIFLALTLIWLKIPAGHEELNLAIRRGGMGALALALLLIAGLYGFYYFREPALKLFRVLLKPLGKRLQEVGLGELEKFSNGLAILGKPSRLIVVMLLSFLVWLVNLTPIWAVGYGFGLKLSLIDALFLLVLGAFAASIPAAPGFWGTFHYITSKGLAFLGVLNPEQALSFAIVLHSFYFFPTTIAGLILAWREGYSVFDLEQKAGRVGNDTQNG
jgi:hypothetical protein